MNKIQKELVNNKIKACAICIIKENYTIERLEKFLYSNYDLIENENLINIIPFESFKALIMSKVNAFNSNIF